MATAAPTRRQWTEQERRNKRAEYARLYATGHNRKGQSVTVPDDVVRVEESTPCFLCGIARGPCRHRGWLA